jgi:hypothetical protein
MLKVMCYVLIQVFPSLYAFVSKTLQSHGSNDELIYWPCSGILETYSIKVAKWRWIDPSFSTQAEALRSQQLCRFPPQASFLATQRRRGAASNDVMFIILRQEVTSSHE